MVIIQLRIQSTEFVKSSNDINEKYALFPNDEFFFHSYKVSICKQVRIHYNVEVGRNVCTTIS